MNNRHVKKDVFSFLYRRESPWKVDGESTGVPSKLKVLEEELLNWEKVGKSNSPKVSSSMRKQAKRYQDLAAKIDELCRRMVILKPLLHECSKLVRKFELENRVILILGCFSNTIRIRYP